MSGFRAIVVAALVALATANCSRSESTTTEAQTSSAIDVAREAYIYGFPLVDFYRIYAAYFLFPHSPVYKAAVNTLVNTPNVYTPADTTVQTPNSDTPYSFAFLDLRSQPYVLTLPPIEKNRYYSVQLVDLYTNNFAYLGTRTTGNTGGHFLIAGPDWHGTARSGITKVAHCTTQFALVLIRTQLFDLADLGRVHEIQAGYKVQPLSSFAGTPAPPVAPSIHWVLPMSAAPPKEFSVKAWLTDRLMPPERTSPKFYNLLSFVLQFCPVLPTDADTRKSFASIGVQPGGFRLPSGVTTKDLTDGMAAGQAAIDDARAKVSSSTEVFAPNSTLFKNALARSVAAQVGILGNSPQEAIYLTYQKDANGNAPTGAKTYVVRFAPGKLPPVKAFWSLTMYDMPQQLLVANPLNRYLINSPMLPQLKRDKDGGLTLYVQHGSPGKDWESNWLPAPAGGFFMVLRCYYPDASVIDGSWKQPPLQPV
jgi:hypothetical protein